MKKTSHEVKEYDQRDTTAFINPSKPLKLSDIGFSLPAEEPTKVISIRIPTDLYNRIKAYSTNIDMPYQAYIKYILNDGVQKDLNKSLGHKKIKRAS
jgi:predicted DNA binding CopG/RHH family protein